MRFLIILSIFALCLIGVAGYYSSLEGKQSDRPLASAADNESVSALSQLGEDENFPHHFMEQSVIKRYDAKGNIEQQFDSSRIQYFDTDQPNANIQLQQPKISLQNLKAGHLLAFSSTAKFEVNSGMLRLDGEVLFQQNHENIEREFTTSQLFIDTKNKTVNTDKQVQMVQQGILIKAVGMEADINAGYYQLNSKVSGIYHAN